MAIWVTAIGVVSPLAPRARETMDRLLAGERAFGPLGLFELAGARTSEVAAAAELDVATPGLREGEESSRTDRMAIAAAAEALDQAGLGAGAIPVDLVAGGTTAGLFETEGYLAEMARDPGAARPRQLMLSHPLSATVDRMRAAWPAFRRARSLCSACSSAANAIALGASWIETGRSERVLAGGADGLCRLTFAGFHALGALSAEPCRPFDRSRRGLSLGEGAAFLLLESDTAARARGAEPIVELRGWAIGSECHHITNPEPGGATAARVMRAALARARLEPADVGYVNAHGTGTVLNDVMEIAALRACFGASLERVAVSSAKGQLGHTMGAAGAIEAAITAMALARGELPPTGGLDDVAPECVGPRHLRQSERCRVRAALSSSFGFGGTDTVLVLAAPGAFEPLEPRRRCRVVVSGAAIVGPLGVTVGRDATGYFDPERLPAPGPVRFEGRDHLDLERARHIDRAGRLVTTAVQAALAGAGAARAGRLGAGVAPGLRPRAGAIVGSAYGPVEASAAFVRRVQERGARGAVPAAFPNLVPSSPVAHAAIYLGLGGPVLAASDLGTTAESAMLTAIELIEAGEADLVAAGSVEELGAIVQSVLEPLYAEQGQADGFSEGAAVALFESEESSLARAQSSDGALRPIAEVRWATSWRGSPHAALEGLPRPREHARSIVVLGQPADPFAEWLARGAWRRVPVRPLASRVGRHAGLGGFAVAAGLGLLAAGEVDEVLLLGAALDRGAALLLGLFGGGEP